MNQADLYFSINSELSGSDKHHYHYDKRKDFCCIKLLSRGRIGRTKYFLSTAGITLCGILLIALLSLVPVVGSTLAIIYFLGMIGYNLLLTAQRCHDINLSGWMALIALIPFASTFFYLMPGTKDINRYGLKPRPCCPEAKIGAAFLASLFAFVFIGIIVFYEFQQELSI